MVIFNTKDNARRHDNTQKSLKQPKAFSSKLSEKKMMLLIDMGLSNKPILTCARRPKAAQLFNPLVRIFWSVICYFMFMLSVAVVFASLSELYPLMHVGCLWQHYKPRSFMFPSF